MINSRGYHCLCLKGSISVRKFSFECNINLSRLGGWAHVFASLTFSFKPQTGKTTTIETDISRQSCVPPLRTPPEIPRTSQHYVVLKGLRTLNSSQIELNWNARARPSFCRLVGDNIITLIRNDPMNSIRARYNYLLTQ